MALEKIVSVDLIEVVENGTLQVRTKTSIKEDGIEISSKFHRHVVVPGADYSAEDAKVKAIAASIHTAEVIAAYVAAQEAVALPA
tara:strand:+ start:1320 stop:1574 length:255 start_codon:yes stop_codon:yes gene_type:complete